MSNVIYTLNDNEKKEIEELFEKKIALENLIKSISLEQRDLYNSLLEDYTKNNTLYLNWFNKMKKKYSWSGENWRVDFETGEVSVI